tara:strand:- start:685 stop:864 length:180 start_codon:yes stop_codon:yes gene_type:complete
MSNSEILSRGVAGLTGSTIAVIAPYQEYIQWFIQVLGGILGITVAVLTLWNLIRKKDKK